ncbi:carboxy-S-adenosyl-L-methionine synthase [Campylobacterota bacterium]|nr:carboxy-S-adenosyl-L-methionine synthase [Campylobacterota bacterium]
MTDSYFQQEPDKQFEFDAAVAGVFDDMLSRSVPFYKESIKLSAEMIARWCKNGTVVDLGCSTGSMLLLLHKIAPDLTLIGIDSSDAMIAIAKQKAAAFGAKISYQIADATTAEFNDLSALSANYLLQFIRPAKRNDFVRKIYNSLGSDGIFIFSEKLACEHKRLDKLMIDRYMDFKRENGYSDFEIAKKREALDNVLIPYTQHENQEMVLQAGFSFVESVLRWNNFATFIAIK